MRLLKTEKQRKTKIIGHFEVCLYQSRESRKKKKHFAEDLYLAPVKSAHSVQRYIPVNKRKRKETDYIFSHLRSCLSMHISFFRFWFFDYHLSGRQSPLFGWFSFFFFFFFLLSLRQVVWPRSIRIVSTEWATWSTGNCARNLNLSMRKNGIWTTQHLSWFLHSLVSTWPLRGRNCVSFYRSGLISKWSIAYR